MSADDDAVVHRRAGRLRLSTGFARGFTPRSGRSSVVGMTAVVAQTSATGTTPVAEGLARVHASIDGLGAAEVGEVSGRDVAEVDRAMTRLAAVKLSMVAAAHRQGAARRAGMT